MLAASLLTDALPPVEGLVFGDPNGLTKDEQDHNGKLLRAYAKANAQRRWVSAPITGRSRRRPSIRSSASGRMAT